MMLNSWGDRISVYCLNHKEPLKMNIISNTEHIKTPFYACENYLSEGNSCPNRLNLDDYQNIIFKFLEKIEALGPGGDLTNYTFIHKGTRQRIKVRVLKYNDDEIRLGILNLTVLGLKS